MNRIRKVFKRDIVGVLAIISVLFSGCTGKDKRFGSDILPHDRHLVPNFRQFLSEISAKTVYDTVVVGYHDSLAVDTVIFGSFNDPILGKTNAALAAQLGLTGKPKISENPKIDSVMLKVFYDGVYGDTLTKQTVKVYELEKELLTNGRYYSPLRSGSVNDVKPGSADIGSASFLPGKRRSSKNKFIKVALDNAWGQKFLMDTTNFDDNEKFLKVLKGIYLEADPVIDRGALLRLDPRQLRVSFYYHEENHKDSTQNFTIWVTDNSVVVPRYTFDYTDALLKPEDSEKESRVVVRPNAGTKVELDITGLENWADSASLLNSLVTNAQLSIKVDTIISDLDQFPVPLQLMMKASSDTIYFPGFFNSKKGIYSFNITAYVIDVINKKKEGQEFFIFTPDSRSSYERVILNTSNSTSSLKLDIFYSTVKKEE